MNPNTLAEQIRKPSLQGFEMASDSGPDHDAAGIDGLAVLAISLAGADRAEEAVFEGKGITGPGSSIELAQRKARRKILSCDTALGSNLRGGNLEEGKHLAARDRNQARYFRSRK